MEIINIVVLSVSGLLLIYAGTNRLFRPIKSLCLKIFLDDPKIKLEGKVDIYSEMRGAGASLAIGGIIILLGIFITKLMLASFIVAIVIYLGYAIGRLVGLRTDGKPNKDIVQGLKSELVLGGANIFCLVNTLV